LNLTIEHIEHVTLSTPTDGSPLFAAMLATLTTSAKQPPARKQAETATSQPPRIGDMWPEQGGIYAGLMRGVNGGHDYHLIVPPGPEALAESIAWGAEGEDEPGAASEWDGLANTLALTASSHSHPAAEWATSLAISGHQDFYIPSRREARLCWVNVPELFTAHWFWTSTQYSRRYAWNQTFDAGSQSNHTKGYEGRARAVRRLIA
jgi:hypothetical protein